LLIAVILMAITLPLLARRMIEARQSRKLIDRNARTLHRHYEGVDDAMRLQKLPAELRMPGKTMRVEFAIRFDGTDAASVAQRSWGDVERLGLAVRTERTGPSHVTLFGSTNLPSGDASSLTHLHLQLERIARDHGGAYAGWNAGPAKMAG
jgi:hypothetical protein